MKPKFLQHAQEDLDALRDSDHYDEILRLTDMYGEEADLEFNAVEFATHLEDAALSAPRETDAIAAAIQKRYRELMDSSEAT